MLVLARPVRPSSNYPDKSCVIGGYLLPLDFGYFRLWLPPSSFLDLGLGPHPLIACPRNWRPSMSVFFEEYLDFGLMSNISRLARSLFKPNRLVSAAGLLLTGFCMHAGSSRLGQLCSRLWFTLSSVLLRILGFPAWRKTFVGWTLSSQACYEPTLILIWLASLIGGRIPRLPGRSLSCRPRGDTSSRKRWCKTFTSCTARFSMSFAPMELRCSRIRDRCLWLTPFSIALSANAPSALPKAWRLTDDFDMGYMHRSTPLLWALLARLASSSFGRRTGLHSIWHTLPEMVVVIRATTTWSSRGFKQIMPFKLFPPLFWEHPGKRRCRHKAPCRFCWLPENELFEMDSATKKNVWRSCRISLSPAMRRWPTLNWLNNSMLRSLPGLGLCPPFLTLSWSQPLLIDFGLFSVTLTPFGTPGPAMFFWTGAITRFKTLSWILWMVVLNQPLRQPFQTRFTSSLELDVYFGSSVWRTAFAVFKAKLSNPFILTGCRNLALPPNQLPLEAVPRSLAAFVITRSGKPHFVESTGMICLATPLSRRLVLACLQRRSSSSFTYLLDVDGLVISMNTYINGLPVWMWRSWSYPWTPPLTPTWVTFLWGRPAGLSWNDSTWREP